VANEQETHVYAAICVLEKKNNVDLVGKIRWPRLVIYVMLRPAKRMQVFANRKRVSLALFADFARTSHLKMSDL
jgi:hypothetical protein